MQITYSSDNGNFTRKDLDVSSKITEKYFGMQKDASQIPATKENKDWIYKNIPDCINLIRDGKKIIGYTFIIPCREGLMEDFVKNSIDEATLFEKIKKKRVDFVPEAIYLCASVIQEDYRGKGLATSGFLKTINKVTQNITVKPTLFYWAYSKEGKSLAEKIAELTGLELILREQTV